MTRPCNSTPLQADHAVGPWCDGGEWLGALYSITRSYGGVGYDCNNFNKYTVCPSTDPTCERCLECAARPTSNTYLIPVAPKKAASKGSAEGAFNYGSAIALNGVPLAGPEPVAQLTALKNPAPLVRHVCVWVLPCVRASVWV